MAARAVQAQQAAPANGAPGPVVHMRQWLAARISEPARRMLDFHMDTYSMVSHPTPLGGTAACPCQPHRRDSGYCSNHACFSLLTWVFTVCDSISRMCDSISEIRVYNHQIRTCVRVLAVHF